MHGIVPPPHQPISTLQHLEAHERIAALSDRYAAGPAAAIIAALVHHEYPGRTAVVSSFGAESAVLLHLVASVDASVPIIFLDTLRHFQETLDYQQRLSRHLGLRNVIIARPSASGVAAEDPHNDLAGRDPDRCCHVRKTLPMIRALQPFECLLTGRKRFQSDTRAALPVFEMQGRWIKANPIATWDRQDLDSYFVTFELPHHPLEAQGYPSIGCAPCTRAVAPGEDPRAGRWAEHDKAECGIHFGLDGTVRRG